jgi:hypothetical protein
MPKISETTAFVLVGDVCIIKGVGYWTEFWGWAIGGGYECVASCWLGSPPPCTGCQLATVRQPIMSMSIAVRPSTGYCLQ